MKYVFLFLSILFISCSQDALIDKVDTSQDEFFRDGEVEIIFENDVENGINVIFIGDAYIQEDLGKTYGIYREHGRRNIKALFETPPFSEYKEHFNAYIIYVESQEDMIKVLDGPDMDTAFSSFLTDGGPNGFTILNLGDYDKLDLYTSKLTNAGRTEKELILMSVNNSGRGSALLGSNVGVFGGGNERTMLHEVGHAFASLGDEYFFEGIVNDGDTDPYPNLDRTDNPKLVKWNHFIGLDYYGRVGAYEGGLYTPNGVWRPENNSLMKSSSSFYSFNAPSREAIVKRILELRNIEYNFETFLEIDLISMENINSGRNVRAASPQQQIDCGNIYDLH